MSALIILILLGMSALILVNNLWKEEKPKVLFVIHIKAKPGWFLISIPLVLVGNLMSWSFSLENILLIVFICILLMFLVIRSSLNGKIEFTDASYCSPQTEPIKVADITHFEITDTEFIVHSTKYRNHDTVKLKNLRGNSVEELSDILKAYVEQNPHIKFIYSTS